MLAGVRIVVAVTHPASAGFYAGQLAALRRAGAEVAFLSSPSEAVAAQCADEGAQFVPIAIERAPSPWRDARALAQVTAALNRLKPDVVNAGTPKAGLLGMIAAAGLRVRHRIHTLHGLRYEAARGAQRRAYWLAQRASCALATEVVCVSPSLRARAIETGLLRDAIVIGDGSVNGVDTETFRRTSGAIAAGRALRARLGIPEDATVAGYLGRLAHDKGVDELPAIWARARGGSRRLLVAGELDATDPPDPRALDELRGAPDVATLGHVDDTAAFLASLDVLVLPTHREGFPTAPLEAAAMEVPVVATRATGCVDAIVDGVTGGLAPVGDPEALGAALDRYLGDPELRRAHGRAGRANVEARFTRDHVHRLTVEHYRDVVGRT